MHKTPLMSRLAQAYEDSKLLYFVTDGEGNCMLDRVTQVDAQIYAMKNCFLSDGSLALDSHSVSKVSQHLHRITYLHNLRSHLH